MTGTLARRPSKQTAGCLLPPGRRRLRPARNGIGSVKYRKLGLELTVRTVLCLSVCALAQVRTLSVRGGSRFLQRLPWITNPHQARVVLIERRFCPLSLSSPPSQQLLNGTDRRVCCVSQHDDGDDERRFLRRPYGIGSYHACIDSACVDAHLPSWLSNQLSGAERRDAFLCAHERGGSEGGLAREAGLAPGAAERALCPCPQWGAGPGCSPGCSPMGPRADLDGGDVQRGRRLRVRRAFVRGASQAGLA